MSEAQEAVRAVERAMVAIRRLQTRRALGRAPGLDPAMASVVDVVEEHGEAGTPCTVSSIAEALAVDQPRASRLAARAVDEGFLRRTPDQHDARRTLLTLTAKGRVQAAGLHDFRRAQFARAMAGWNAREAATFATLLTRFVGAYDEQVRERG